MRNQALSLVIKGSGKKAFDGWKDWRYELLEKAICLCNEKMAIKLEKVLNVFLEDSKNDYYPEHVRQEDVILRYKLPGQLKGADAVKDELYANLNIREICVIAVNDAVETKDSVEAENYVLNR